MNWNATYEITVNIRNIWLPLGSYCYWTRDEKKICYDINCDDCKNKFYPATRDKSPQAFHSMYIYYHQGNPGIINLIKTYPGRR